MRLLKQPISFLSLSIAFMSMLAMFIGAGKAYAEEEWPEGLESRYDDTRKQYIFTYNPVVPGEVLEVFHYFIEGHPWLGQQNVAANSTNMAIDLDTILEGAQPGDTRKLRVAITTFDGTVGRTTTNGDQTHTWPSITVGDDGSVEDPQASITNIQINAGNQTLTIDAQSGFIPDSTQAQLIIKRSGVEIEAHHVTTNNSISQIISYANWGLEPGPNNITVEFRITQDGTFLVSDERSTVITIDDEVPGDPQASIANIQVDADNQTLTVSAQSESIPSGFPGGFGVQAELIIKHSGAVIETHRVTTMNDSFSQTISYADWGLEPGPNDITIEFRITQRGTELAADTRSTVITIDEEPEEPQASITNVEVNADNQTMTVNAQSEFIPDGSLTQARLIITGPPGVNEERSVAINESILETFSYADWGLEAGSYSVTAELRVTRFFNTIVSDNTTFTITVDEPLPDNVTQDAQVLPHDTGGYYIQFTLKADEPIQSATVYYKAQEENSFRSLPMENPVSDNEYVIGTEALSEGEYSYYIEYRDSQGRPGTTSRETVSVGSGPDDVDYTADVLPHDTGGHYIDFAIGPVQSARVHYKGEEEDEFRFLDMSDDTGDNQYRVGTESLPDGTYVAYFEYVTLEGENGTIAQFRIEVPRGTPVGYFEEVYSDYAWHPNSNETIHVMFRNPFVYPALGPSDEGQVAYDKTLHNVSRVFSIVRKETEFSDGKYEMNFNVRPVDPDNVGNSLRDMIINIEDGNPVPLHRRILDDLNDGQPFWQENAYMTPQPDRSYSYTISQIRGRPADSESCFAGGQLNNELGPLEYGDCVALRIQFGFAVDEPVGITHPFYFRVGMPGRQNPYLSSGDEAYIEEMSKRAQFTGTADKFFPNVIDITHRTLMQNTDPEVFNNSVFPGKMLFDNEYRAFYQQQDYERSFTFLQPNYKHNLPAAFYEGDRHQSCVSCHENDMGGSGLRTQTAPIKLFGARADAEYGANFYTNAEAGTRPDGTVVVPDDDDRFEVIESGTFNDGMSYTIKKEKFSLIDNMGQPLPLGDDLHALALYTPRVIGLGALEAISDEWIIANDREQAGRGGFLRFVEARNSQGELVSRPARFGSGVGEVAADLEGMTRIALHGEMNITSIDFPNLNCAPNDPNCQGVNPTPVDEEWVGFLADYLRAVPILAREYDKLYQPDVLRGEELFEQAFCSDCHTSKAIDTGEDSKFPAFHNTWVKPYTDFRFYDLGIPSRMGGESAGENGDGIIHLKTRSLINIGYTTQANGTAGTAEACGFYISTIGACTIMEAILLHGGDAQSSKDHVLNVLNADDRQALVEFVLSL